MWYDKTNVVFYKDSHNKRNKMFRKEFYIWKRSIHRNGNKTCQHLKKKTDQFYAGELSKADYKGFSGGYGSYAQKDGKASMIRLRMSGGHLTKDKLKFIADSIKTYNVDKSSPDDMSDDSVT